MKRYEHIDISKGIGILLVVFFHLPGVNRLIYFNISVPLKWDELNN